MVPTGKVYVALTGDNQVVRLTPTSTSFALDTSFNKTGRIGNADKSAGAGPAALNAPYDVTVDTAENTIYISDTGNQRVQRYSSSGAFIRSIVSPGSPSQPLKSPKGIVSINLDIFAVDAENNSVASLDEDDIRHFYGKISNDALQFNAPLGLDHPHGADAGRLAHAPEAPAHRTNHLRVDRPARTRRRPVYRRLADGQLRLGVELLHHLFPGAIMLVAIAYSVDPEPSRLKLLRGGDWWGMLCMAIGLGSFITLLEEG